MNKGIHDFTFSGESVHFLQRELFRDKKQIINIMFIYRLIDYIKLNHIVCTKKCRMFISQVELEINCIILITS